MAGIGGWARTAPDAPAFITPRGAISFGDLDRRQRALAGAFSDAGLTARDRIAVHAANRAEYLELTCGALRAGIVPVPIHRSLTGAEVAYVLEDSGSRWLFTDRPMEGRPGLERIITFGDALERLLHEAKPAPLADFIGGRPMHYTSGTTGQPKGVWVEPYAEDEAARRSDDFRRLWGLADDEVHLVCSPLSHSAPHRFAARTLEAGGAVTLLERFDPAEMLARIDLFSVTSTFTVPTHLERLFALKKPAARHDLSSLRLMAHAGAPIRESTKRRALEYFPEDSVWEFYGSTEGQVARISSREWLAKPGSVGLPGPGISVQIVDEDGTELPAGEVGEIWVEDDDAERFVYWRDDDKTRAAWRGRAWTVGDLGLVDDDGYLWLAGRKFDTIITGGVNVYPQEVEAVLATHPSIAEVVVYGRAHPEWGEEVCALVVASFGQPLEPDALQAWARERLAGYKCPRDITVVDELPRTPTGKPKRDIE